MNCFWETIECDSGGSLARIPDASRNVVVLSTHFDPRHKYAPQAPQARQLDPGSVRLLEECARVLANDGLLFVYGLPRDLVFWGERISTMGCAGWRMVFKYWIALAIDAAPRGDFLKPTHQGLLLFLKSETGSKPQFRLNTAAVKVPHAFCAACGKNLKDWGGKKHLMNPKGAALSDVWRDLPEIKINCSVAPAAVLDRIEALTTHDGVRGLHVIQTRPAFAVGSESLPAPVRHILDTGSPKDRQDNCHTIQSLEQDKVYLGDCVLFLNRAAELHPEGVFDLAFADPPYNLQKLYGNYDDALAEEHYLAWCNAWLEGMARTLKPGGSLFVLNLPKWAIHHAAFLNRHLQFRHWIAWDALSDPRGKLMPAHYALLYYTKPGAKPVFNYSPLASRHPSPDAVPPPDSPKYCLRAACVRSRKLRGDDEKIELSDIWFDIHRIKHKRDRDAHPCQLPERLLERIILLTTHRGGLVFDPFCGTGTTAIAAAKLGRRFVVVDCDPAYVRITNEKLAAMKQNADLFGDFAVPRKSVARRKAAASKRAVETYLQSLARKLGRMPTEADIEADRPEVLREIDAIYPYRGAALKRCKVALAATEPGQ